MKGALKKSGLDDLQIGLYYYEGEATSTPLDIDTEIVYVRPLFWPIDAKWWERVLGFFYPRYKDNFLHNSESPVIKFKVSQ